MVEFGKRMEVGFWKGKEKAKAKGVFVVYLHSFEASQVGFRRIGDLTITNAQIRSDSGLGVSCRMADTCLSKR